VNGGPSFLALYLFYEPSARVGLVYDIGIMNIEDRRPAHRPRVLGDLKWLYISIPKTNHPIYFLFRSRVRFSGSADRMELLDCSWEFSLSAISTR